jgi:hypothetical protein
MNAKQFDAAIKRVIKKHGPILDLRKDPEVLVDIVRSLGGAAAEGPVCGGTPPVPSKAGAVVTNEDIMRAILKLSRDVDTLKRNMR